VAAPVIVTRPAAPGQRLATALQRRGWTVAWWPAFEIAPPPDDTLVRRTLSRLAGYDLALFVSPNAVHATAERYWADWPASTAIGVVGGGTRAAALAELRGAAAATIVGPDEDDEAGSESFWRAWQASGRAARRVLLLRAAAGREWIAERLREAGAEVDALAVYERQPRSLDDAERDQLAAWTEQATAPVVIVSSSEAVGAIVDQVAAVAGASDWLRGGVAIATHERVAQRLRSAGFARVENCAPDDSALIGKLESFAV
jgi:uroporphyrinogen-III synthase